MIGLIGTALGIGIMARVATGVCRSIERPYGQRPRYPRNNNYRRYPNRYNDYRKKQHPQQLHQQSQPNTNQQQLPLQQPQQPNTDQQQHKQKPRPRYNSRKPMYSYKPKPMYDKNRKKPYWKTKVI